MDLFFFVSLIVWSLASFARRNIYYFFGFSASTRQVAGRTLNPSVGTCFSTHEKAKINEALEFLRLLSHLALASTLAIGALAVNLLPV